MIENIDIFKTNMAPSLADRRVIIQESTFKKILGLLNRVDFLKSLANCLKFFMTRFWTTLLVTTS